MGGGFLYLNGDIGVELEVLGKPDGGKMAPSQFLDEHVPFEENFPKLESYPMWGAWYPPIL